MRILSPLYKIFDQPDENLNTDIPKYIGRYQQSFFLMEIFINNAVRQFWGHIIRKQDLVSHYGKTTVVMFLKGPWSNLFYMKQYDMA